MAVSPDGKSVYVTASDSNSLLRFNRDTATGSLGFAGCFANGGANGCADPSPGNSPLGKAWDVAVSPDGKSVYVTSPGIGVNALSSFDRGADGSLSFAGCFGEDSGCGQIGGDPLNGLHGVSISPDGKNVYVAGSGAASLVTFNRATDGALSFAGCIANEGARGCGDPGRDSLGGAWDVAVSADGANVYLVSIDSDSITWFDRAAGGSLAVAGCIADNGNRGCADPSPGNEPLDNPRSVAVSPDGRSVYVASLLANSISRFVRAVPPPTGDRVYWTNYYGGKLSFTNLDGSGGGDLSTGAASMSAPDGATIDAAAGRIYWANHDSGKISFANLDGSGGGDLNTGKASVIGPVGVAIDPAAGRIYWANESGAKISYANLDGSGGGDLNTEGATMHGPHGVAIDPAAGRIYWANYGTPKISYANLDGGGGGGDLDTTGAIVSEPNGVAIDAAAGRIYWANRGAGISYANLNGSGGGGNLVTTGATVSAPYGVAIDPAAGRIYWANYYADKISSASTGGGGGSDLSTFGASRSGTTFPILLETPSGSGAPAIGGGSVVGSTLSCSQGSWAPDLLGAFLYRAPQSFAYRWSRDGADIAGATASSYPAGAAGTYRCTVTASNRAGGGVQSSAPHAVEQAQPPPPPSNAFSFGRLTLNRKKGTAKLAVKVPGPGALKLSGREVVTRSVAARRAGSVTLTVTAKGRAKRRLDRTGTAKVKLKVAYTPSGGSARTKSKTVKLVKRR